MIVAIANPSKTCKPRLQEEGGRGDVTTTCAECQRGSEAPKRCSFGELQSDESDELESCYDSKNSLDRSCKICIQN